MRYKVERRFKPKTSILGLFTCRECEKDFEGYYTYNRLVLCSEQCREIRYTRQRKASQAKYRAKNYKPPTPRECVMCTATYTPGGTRSDSRFCSLKCCMRGNQIERTYGIGLDRYHDMYKKQQGLCAGCGLPFNELTPYVDHDHTTGNVRGLLHRNCNSVLGFVDDDAEILDRLAKYLREE